MPKGGPKLPASQLTLPGGFLIQVAYRSDKQCKRDAGTKVWGYWARGADGGKIVLNSEAPLWKQLKIFGHELVHAVHDYALWLDDRADQVKAEADETLKAFEEED